MFIIDFLNGNHGAVTAIATLIIAGSAIISVWISKELAKENRLLRKASTEPEVAAFLKPDSRRNHVVYLVLANRGQPRTFCLLFEQVGLILRATKYRLCSPLMQR